MRRLCVETKRLVLRPLRKADYWAWYESNVDCGPARNKWDHGPCDPAKHSKVRYEQLVRWYREMARKDEYYFYGAFLKSTGQLVGHVDFDIYVRRDLQFANFGYRVHNLFWGHGYGREAAAVGLGIGFNYLKLNRLEAAIHLDNRKSIRLCRKIGMKREGIKRRYWFEDDQWIDHLIYVANPEDIGLTARKPD